MLAAMPGSLLIEWLAYCEIDPFGNERGDLQAAMVVSTLANIYRDPKKQKKAFQPGDFMPKFDDSTASQRSAGRQTPTQMLEVVKLINAALGGSEVQRDA